LMLRLGGSAQVVEPGWLAEMVRETAARALRHYA
jgi:predicted DNA-binding transcriptional regulator YafY